MNNLLYQQIDEVLTRSENRAVLECERPLRIAAATLCRTPSGVITATTVVCDVANAQIDSVESLVAEIADEYGLEAWIQRQRGSFSVRFTQPHSDEPIQSVRSERSLLAKLFGRQEAPSGVRAWNTSVSYSGVRY